MFGLMTTRTHIKRMTYFYFFVRRYFKERLNVAYKNYAELIVFAKEFIDETREITKQEMIKNFEVFNGN